MTFYITSFLRPALTPGCCRRFLDPKPVRYLRIKLRNEILTTPNARIWIWPLSSRRTDGFVKRIKGLLDCGGIWGDTIRRIVSGTCIGSLPIDSPAQNVPESSYSKMQLGNVTGFCVCHLMRILNWKSWLGATQFGASYQGCV